MKMILAAGLCAIAACGASGMTKSKAIFVAESECPAADVEAVELTDDVYLVSGCGAKQVFSCQNTRSRDLLRPNVWQGDTCQPTGDRTTEGGTPERRVARRPKPAPAATQQPVVVEESPFAPGKIVQYTDEDGVLSPVTIDLVDKSEASVTLRNGKHVWVPLKSLTPPEQ